MRLFCLFGHKWRATACRDRPRAWYICIRCGKRYHPLRLVGTWPTKEEESR